MPVPALAAKRGRKRKSAEVVAAPDNGDDGSDTNDHDDNGDET